MTKIASLKQHKKDRRIDVLYKRLSELVASRKQDFESLKAKNIVLGEWGDSKWIYQSRGISFLRLFDIHGKKVISQTSETDVTAYEGVWADLLRVSAVAQVIKKKAVRTISSDITAAKYLIEALEEDYSRIITLSQVDVEKCVDVMQSVGLKTGSVYLNYGKTIAFIKTILVANELCPYFIPKNGLKSPHKEKLDSTSKEFKERSEHLFNDRIDEYIAIAKRRYEEDARAIAEGKDPIYGPQKPIYDELRFLAIPFFLAFGLRVGELCRLRDDCLQFDEINERWYLNVYTEKGQLPHPRPVPRQWEKVLCETHQRILEITKIHREWAKKIDIEGIDALYEALDFSDVRTESMRQTLGSAGYIPEEYLLGSELQVSRGIYKPHTSGITYDKLKQGGYEGAVVGKLPMPGRGATNFPRLYSRKLVAEIAYQKYREIQSQVFAENFVDAADYDLPETYSSNSFFVEMPFHRHLFIAREDTFTLQKGADGLDSGFLPSPMTQKNLSHWLSDQGSRSRSLFSRYDVRDEDGEIVEIKNHQFRRWLTTALIRSGKNEMMIDLFMGRQAGQTRHYDYRTAKERAELARERYMSDSQPDDALGRRVQRMRNNGVSPEAIESAIMDTLRVAHYTPWGLCWRDLDVSPCEKGMMCMRGKDGQGCGHFGIDPSDEEARKSIHNTKVHYENQLAILLPNYQELLHELNSEEPLDQHIQFCLETLQGCEAALNAYENYERNSRDRIGVVQVFDGEEIK